MMKNVVFWGNWTKPHRLIYQFFLGVLLAASVFYITSYLGGNEQVFDWEIQTERKYIENTYDTVDFGFFSIPINALGPVIYQYFSGSGLHLDPEVATAFIVLFLLSAALLLTVFTFLPRNWYIVGMVLFIAAVVGMRLENLLLFNSLQKWPAVLLFLVMIPLTYYFNSIKTGFSFSFRLGVVAGVLLLFSLLIYFFSGVDHPALHIVNYGFYVPFLITILFILTISHEVVNALLYLASKSEESNMVRPFSILSVLYLANLALLYLNRISVIDWSFYFVDLTFLFLVSTFIGIWGLIRRSQLHEHIIPFRPYGAFLYLGIAVISLSTAGYYYATGNDPLTTVIEDTILYGHIGFGLVFFIYVISNFGQLLSRRFQVYKVVYDPKVMPYFTFRLAGIITVLALFLQANWKSSWYRVLSGYYNGIGDLYYTTGQLVTAREYYKEGSDYGLFNHRSNYVLGRIYEERGERSEAARFYAKALELKPTPMAYVNYANVQGQQEASYEKLFTLQDALEEFPRSGQVMNNLGLAMMEVGVIDSALIYFHYASEEKDTREPAGNNYLALVAEQDLNLDRDSLAEKYGSEANLASASNRLLFRTNKSESFRLEPSDTLLDPFSAAYVVNYLNSGAVIPDSTQLKRIWQLRDLPANYRYRESIGAALAINYYQYGDLNHAFRLMDLVANSSFNNRGYYLNKIGLWLLEHGDPVAAERRFNDAATAGERRAFFNKALAQLDQGELYEAGQLIAILNANNRQPFMQAILRALSLRPDSIGTASPDVQYLFGRYRLSQFDEQERERILQRIPGDQTKAMILADLAGSYYYRENFRQARYYFNLIDGLTLRDRELEQRIRFTELCLLAAEGQLEVLQSRLEEFHREQVPQYENQVAFFEWITEGKVPAADELSLMANNPFFPPGVVRVVDYYNKTTNDPGIGYNLIVDAVEVNPRSPTLLISYAMQCARMGFESYGKFALQDLAEFISPEDLEVFRQEFESLLKQSSEWGG